MSDPTVWYVGFCPIHGPPSLVQRFLRRGYAHCWAAKYIADDLWQWVEWTPERIILGLADDALLTRASAGATEVWAVVQMPDAPVPRRPILALQHCATLVSHVVGLRPPPWATPWTLRCALKQAGAVCIVTQEPAA